LSEEKVQGSMFKVQGSRFKVPCSIVRMFECLIAL
jgi:hypothetical protein